MTAVKAFVGHSFEENDEEVVGKFIAYFNSIAGSSIGFSWTSARPAQAKDLADKVIPLIQNTNTFIGICTRKERVISNASLRRLPRSWVLAPEGELSWKTSDWVTQEIGLALGLGHNLILLLEHGVRPPGGLQGNIEHIPFDRNAPAQAFPRILEMIGDIAGKAASTALVAVPDAGTAVTAVAEVPEDAWTTPQPNWTRGRYEIALMHFTYEGNEEGMKNINEKYLVSEDADEGDNRKTWAAFTEYWKIQFGKNPDLAKLEELAAAHPTNDEIQSYLARAIHTYGGYEKAATIYEKAAAACSDATIIIRLKGEAAKEYVHAGKPHEALRLTSEIRSIAKDGNVDELRVLRILASIAKLQKADQMELGLLERIVDLEPGDTDSRFALAFKYSSLKANELSLFHYQRIPVNQRTSMAWNNIGVALDRLSMDAKGVDAYRSAEKSGEGLAMTNLGRQFMGAGFHDEAKQLFDAALRIEGTHKDNAWQALTNMKELKDKENEKEREVLTTAKQRSEFYKELGRGAAMPDMKQIPPLWNGPQCDFVAALAAGTFTASGEYVRARNALMRFGMLGGGSRTESRTSNGDLHRRCAWTNDRGTDEHYH